MDLLSVENDLVPETAGAPSGEAADPTANSQRAYLTLMYSRYRQPLFRYLHGIVSSKEEAAELVQETYLRVMKQSQMSKFETFGRNYLFTIATNLARDYIRKQRHRHHDILNSESGSHAADSQDEPECRLEWNQAMEAIRASISKLPTVTRDIFVMSRFREMSHEQIAERLGVSVRSVERKMSEALLAITDRLRVML